MTVFKNYFKIVKSFLPTIIIYTVIFSVFAILVTGEGTMDVFQASTPKVAIINNDENGILVNRFIEYVESNSEIIEIQNDETVISDSLFYRNIDFIMFIPENFTEEFISGEIVQIETRRVPDSYASTYAQMLYNRFWSVASVYLEAGLSEEEISNIILKDLKEVAEVRVLDTDQNTLQRASGFYNFTNYTFLAILLFVVGMLMAIYNDKNIKRRNLSSPISIKKFNAQLFLGNACITFLIWLAYVIISVLVFGSVMFTANGLLMMLNALVFCVTALSIAFLIGNLVKNKEAQNGIVNVVALGTSFLCGAFVPQEMLGSFVLSIARFLPPYWFIKNNNEIARLSNFDFGTMQPILINMAIVLAFGIGFFIITNVIGRMRKQS